MTTEPAGAGLEGTAPPGTPVRARWWRCRRVSLTLLIVGGAGGAVFGGVFAAILVLVGLASLVHGQVPIVGAGEWFIPLVQIGMGALGGLTVGLLAAAAGGLVRGILRRVTRSETALSLLPGVISACVAGALTFWMVGQILTLNPLPWTVLVALTTGTVLGRESHMAGRRSGEARSGS